MPTADIGLAARAKGVAAHLLSREALETLAESDGLEMFARGLFRYSASSEAVDRRLDVFALERLAREAADRHLRTLYRWQERRPGVLDVFAAHQDRRSLRALVRGAAQGASAEARLDGLLPTPSLPQRDLVEMAHQALPADVVGHLVQLAHPDGSRLTPLMAASPVDLDLLRVDFALLTGFAERAARAAARADRIVSEYVHELVDLGNAQKALSMADQVGDVTPSDLFVRGGRWLSSRAYTLVAGAGSPQQALARLAAALAHSPLGQYLPRAVKDVAQLDRTFLAAMLKRLERAGRLEPLSPASLLHVLLRIEAQSRDLRALAWGACFDTPAALRKQQLVTPI